MAAVICLVFFGLNESFSVYHGWFFYEIQHEPSRALLTYVVYTTSFLLHHQ